MIERLRDAQVSIVTLPATDLYPAGGATSATRDAASPPCTCCATRASTSRSSSNNVRNAFTPFGKADMLQIGNLLAHVAQFGTPHSQAEVLRMATYDAGARSDSTTTDWPRGRQADLVACDSPVVADVLADIPSRLYVVKRGRLTVETRHETIIHRSAPVPEHRSKTP